MGGFKFGGVIVACLVLMGCETLDLNQIVPRYGTPTQNQGMGETVSTPSRQANIPRQMIEPDYFPGTDELMGVDMLAMEGFFGAPSLRRSEQTSQVWQYATETCVLFIFFYPNDAGDIRASYITSSGVHQDQPSPGDQACVDAVTRMAANAVVTG